MIILRRKKFVRILQTYHVFVSDIILKRDWRDKRRKCGKQRGKNWRINIERSAFYVSTKSIFYFMFKKRVFQFLLFIKRGPHGY